MSENKINDVNAEEVSRQLTDEEINKIIEEKYSDKDDRTKNFIFKSIKKFGDKFDYSKTIVEKIHHSRVIITCFIHGDFEIRTDAFLSSKFGCAKCSYDSMKLNMEEFRKKTKEIFPQYEVVDGQKYVNNHTKIKMHCTIHNCDFEITPGNLLYGKVGCKECNKENIIETSRKFVELELEKYFEDHFGEFCEIIRKEDGTIGYVNQRTPITIMCKECGNVFKISPDEIKRKCRDGWKNLCNVCRGHISFVETCVIEWLNDNKIKYLSEVTHPIEEIVGRSENSPVRIDFQIVYNNINYWIEPAGGQHYRFSKYFQRDYEVFLSQVERDKHVREFCKEHNIIYIEIPYKYFRKSVIYKLLDEIILNGRSPSEIIKIPKIKYREEKGGSEDE